jgi:hypothetical protein
MANTYVTRDSDTAFQDAIDKAHLSEIPGSIFYAGKFMYMYSDDLHDYFKSIESRRYLKVAR